MSYFRHSSAVIDDGATIGNGSKIWHFSHICAGARIGNNTSIGQGVFIGNRAVVGHSCKIQNNVSVYDDVVLEDGVFCGPSMVFTNVYNPRAFVERKTEFRPTVVKRGASLGANCTIVCGVEIGEFAFVGAGAVVTENVSPYALVVGVPSKQIGWISEYGERMDLPLNGEGHFECTNTGQVYNLLNNRVRRIS